MTRIATRAGTAIAAAGAPAAATDDFEDNVDSWHRSLRVANRSPLTILSYSKTAKQFHGFLVSQGMPRQVEHIKRDHVEAFIEHLQEAGKADATVAQHWRSLKAWFNWLAAEDRIVASPMRRMRAPNIVQKTVPVLSTDEVLRLYEVCSGHGFTDRRDRALISLFIATGARLSEMAGLVFPDDVDLDDRGFHLLGKGAKERTVRFTAEAARDLDRYLASRARHPAAASGALWLGQDGPLTASGIYQALKRRARQAGVEMHPHMTRHTYASMWLANGGSEQDLLEQAGWASPVMLLRYGRATRATRRDAHYDTFAPRFARR